jgi:WD40 repeat protein
VGGGRTGQEDATISATAEVAAPTLPDEDLPVVGGNIYRVVAEIGQGGGGRILRAFDHRLGREVALKLPREREGESARRFRNEARVTARLEHPGIVPVHEMGRWANGEPFYAMKLVSGRSLATVLDETHSLDERLPLISHLIRVADAVAYAHSQGVIHRDLKPSNIMLGPFGEALVIDWGLAKDLHAGTDDAPSVGGPSSSPELTAAHTVLGTPAYMAPEQADGPAVDARADVYSLGAILYAVLTGHAPRSGTDSNELLERVRREDPLPVRQREPGIPVELADVADKAMRRDPQSRYADAGELAEELRRFQSGQMVRAHQYSAGTLVRRWLRKNLRLVAITLLALCAVIATVVVSFGRVVHARNLAEARRDQLILMQARSSLASDPTLAVAWAKSYPGREKVVLETIAAEARSLGVARHVLRDCWRAALAPDGVTVACLDHGQLRLWRPGQPARHLEGGGTVQAVKWRSDGSLISGGDDGAVRQWDSAGAAKVLAEIHQPVGNLQIGADGSIAVGGAKGAVLVVAPNGSTWQAPSQPADLVWAEVSPDGKWLAASAANRVAHVWRIGDVNGRELPNPPDTHSLTFSPGSELLAWGSPDGGVRLLDLASGNLRLLRGHQYSVPRVLFSPDGKILASTGQDKTVRLWDLASGRARVIPLADIAWRILYSPDGRWLVAITDQMAEQRLIDLDTFDEIGLRGHGSPLERIQFSRDSRQLLTSATDGETRLWPIEPSPERVLRGHTSPYAALARRADGALVSVAPDAVRVWNLSSAAVAVHPSPMPEGCLFEATDDGKLVFSFCPGAVRIDLESGRAQTLSPHTYHVAAFTTELRRMLLAREDGSLELMDTASGQSRVIARLPLPGTHLASNPDGKRWIASADDGTVRLIDSERGIYQELTGHQRKVRDVAFDRTGELAASAGTDPVVRLWDARSGRARELLGHTSSVERVRFSPTEDLLATASLDGTIRLWQLGSGASRVLPIGAVQNFLEFSADGRFLYSGGADGVVRQWDVARGSLRRVWRGHQGEIEALLVPRDAGWVATYADDHTVRVWPLADAREIPSLAQLSSSEIGADERPVTRE